MGDRANVVFVDGDEFSPVVYLHWDGDRVEKYLQESIDILRAGDISYSCARFIGKCHENIDGNLSLGVYNFMLESKEVELNFESDASLFKHLDPGDRGLYLVDVNSISAESVTCRHLDSYGKGDDLIVVMKENHGG